MTTTAIKPTVGAVRRLDVHFDDMDPVGIMHNARYAILLERAISLFWAEHGFTFSNGGPTRSDMVAAVREFSIVYHAPISSTGPVEVHFWIERLGETSGVYEFRFLSTDHETLHAEGRRVMVKLDPATGRPTPWSQEGRAIAETLLSSPTRGYGLP